MLLTNEPRRVFLDGIDITSHILDLPTTQLLKPDWGSIPDLPTLQIRVLSTDYAFHYLHPVSILYQKRLDNLSLEVRNYNFTTWVGTVESVSVDYAAKQATITGVSSLNKKINLNARIDTSGSTPAVAAENILMLHDILYDKESFAKANQLLDDIPVTIRVQPSVLDWQGTLGDILKLIAVAGVGRFFMNEKGQIGFDSFFSDPTPIITYTISDAEIYDQISIESDEQEPFDGYSVSWLYSQTPETDGSQSKRLQTLDFSGNSVVNLLTQAGALYVGSQWVACSRKRYARIILPIDKKYSIITKMNTFITLNSVYLGINRSCEVIGIDDSDDKFTKLTLRMDQEIE